MKKILLLLSVCSALMSAQAAEKVLYENNFEKDEIGKVPADYLVLDGGFAVKDDNGNKVLELPGSPLDSFSLLFGPTEKENWSVAAKVFGTSKGRRFPAFGVGLNGAGGYKLQVSPGKKLLEIYRGDTAKASVPFEWQSGKWTRLVISLKKSGDKQWKVEGKAWVDGAAEGSATTVSLEEPDVPAAGRALLLGSPFATTPIDYDDLKVTSDSQ